MDRFAPLVIQAIAESLPHARIVSTREGDVERTLEHRVRIARAARADLFMSLHANASPLHNQMGFETFVLDERSWLSEVEQMRLERAREASSSEELRLAVIRDQRRLARWRARSFEFARRLQRRVGEVVPRRLDRGVKQAAFNVLSGVRAPAVLHEIGFFDHRVEGPLLLDEFQLRARARAIAIAVVDEYRARVYQP